MKKINYIKPIIDNELVTETEEYKLIHLFSADLNGDIGLYPINGKFDVIDRDNRISYLLTIDGNSYSIEESEADEKARKGKDKAEVAFLKESSTDDMSLSFSLEEGYYIAHERRFPKENVEWITDKSLQPLSKKYHTIEGYNDCYEVSEIIDGLEKFGLVDAKGNELVPIKYFFTSYRFPACRNRNRIIFVRGGKSGVMDFNENILIEPKYNNIQSITEDLIVAYNEEYKYEFLTENGTLVFKVDNSMGYTHMTDDMIVVPSSDYSKVDVYQVILKPYEMKHIKYDDLEIDDTSYINFVAFNTLARYRMDLLSKYLMNDKADPADKKKYKKIDKLLAKSLNEFEPRSTQIGKFAIEVTKVLRGDNQDEKFLKQEIKRIKDEALGEGPNI